MYPHRIRLRGPWECEPLSRTLGSGPLPPPLHMTLPCRWDAGGLTDFAGRVRYLRHFGAPTGMEPHERLWLTFAGADASTEVRLNGRLLGKHEGAAKPFEFEITNLLSPRNELAVEVESASRAGGLWGEVALEVRCPAFLRDVRSWTTHSDKTSNLLVAGQVVGVGGIPLELRLMLDDQTVASTVLEAAPTGRDFQLAAERLSVIRKQPGSDETARIYRLRIELICSTVVWYQIAEVIEFGAEEGSKQGK